MKPKDFWQECIADAAQDCDLPLTKEQLLTLAEAAEGAHDNYGMAFYSPPDSDRYNAIEREWKARLEAKERELERYRANAERAVKQALPQHGDTQVSIGEYGEVFRHGGRTERIQ